MIAVLARASSPVVSPDYLIWTRYWRLGKQQDRAADDRPARGWCERVQPRNAPSRG